MTMKVFDNPQPPQRAQLALILLGSLIDYQEVDSQQPYIASSKFFVTSQGLKFFWPKWYYYSTLHSQYLWPPIENMNLDGNIRCMIASRSFGIIVNMNFLILNIGAALGQSRAGWK